MKKLLKNKTILITWASWDIWLQTALDCYDHWANLILISNKNKNKIIEKFKNLDFSRIKIYSCDSTNELEVKKIFCDIKLKNLRIDWLFNNAWDLIKRIDFLKSDWKLFLKSFEVNVKIAYLFTKNSLEILNKNSSIVMMSSMTARWWKWDRSSHYWMSKAAIIWLGKSLANELWKNYWVRVNIVTPWYIKWNFHNKYTKKEVELFHAMRNPMWRVWIPKDVSSVVLFLLSDLSSYINWATIDINWWDFIS